MERDSERLYYLARFDPQYENKRYHFVVYGLPAIASALGTYTTARVEIVEGNGWSVNDKRQATPGYKELKYNEAMKSIQNIIDYLGIDTSRQKLEITFEGNLIAASGVGASAAQCTSLARALNDCFNLNLGNEEINKAAYEGEKAYHGTPSGIDNTASTYGGLIWFIKNLQGGANVMDLLQSPIKIPLVIANSGITASTTQVVADVRRFKEENPTIFDHIFEEYNLLANKAKKALINGDINQIGNLMNQNHKLLQEITVSGKINDELVKIAIKSGAIGAKLTGTGRGGLVIALAEDQHTQEIISHSIEKAGYTSWKTVIG